MGRWQPGESGNPLGASVRSRPKPRSAIVAALQRLLTARPNKLNVDIKRDTTATIIAKGLLQRAAKGDARAAERVLEYTVTDNDNAVGSVGFEIPATRGKGDDLISTINAIYGLKLPRERDKPALPEANESAGQANDQPSER